MPARRLPLSLIRMDTALPWNLYDEAGNVLLSRGFVITRNAQLDQQLQRGVYVQEDDFKAYQYPSQSPQSLPSASNAAGARTVNAFQQRELISGKLSLLLREGANEPEIVAKLSEIAAQLATLLNTQAEAMLAGLFVVDHSKYLVAHTLDVAILTECLSRKLDWSEAQRQSAVCAALTMNIGMAEAQTIMALQRKPLTPPQLAMLEAHPQAGCRVLRGCGVTDPLWLEVVADHHEVPDGSGYPAHKQQLSEFTLLVRTLDIYTAMLTPTATRTEMDAATAARTLFVQENKYQNKLAGLLIKELGLYPPGCLVKLKNGDVAIVSRRATASAPMLVHSFINAHGLPMLEPMWRDTQRPEFAIAGAVLRSQVKVQVDPLKIWGAAARH